MEYDRERRSHQHRRWQCRQPDVWLLESKPEGQQHAGHSDEW